MISHSGNMLFSLTFKLAVFGILFDLFCLAEIVQNKHGDPEQVSKILRYDRTHLYEQYSSMNVWLERKW